MKHTIQSTLRILPALFFTVTLACPLQTQGEEEAMAPPPSAGEDSADLAQDLTNPLADIITLPIQANYDDGFGPLGNGSKLQTNIQPVIPFELNEHWNLITRTIIPVTHQEGLFPGAGSQFGLGDINMSLFLVPRPTSDGFVWGAGPVMLFPTATDSLLGANKWSAGPSLVMLRMQGPWTFGVLGNHLWSFAGSGDRSINNTFVQPFVAYTTENAWTFSLQSEMNYDWNANQWAIPVNVAVAKLVKIGTLPVSLQAGVGYWAESAANGPDGFRFRLQANFVLPKS